MPLNKRKKLPAKAGKKRQYLIDNFGELPEDPKMMKNGHILYLYTTNDRSPTKTIHAVKQKYSCDLTQTQLQSLINREKKFARSTNAAARIALATLRTEAFILPRPNPGPSASDLPGPSQG